MRRKDIKNKRQEKILHIINTAAEVFSKRGYAGASTYEIAELAGISKRSMYYYVGDKETLYLSVLKRIYEDIYNTLISSIDEDLGPEQKLKILLQNLVQIGENRQLNAIVLRELISEEEFLPEYFEESMISYFDIFKGIFEEGIEKCGFIKINPITICIMFLSFFILRNLLTPILKKSDKWVDDENFKAFSDDTGKLTDEMYSNLLKLIKNS